MEQNLYSLKALYRVHPSTYGLVCQNLIFQEVGPSFQVAPALEEHLQGEGLWVLLMV